MHALNLNYGTRSLAFGYGFSKCGEFAFEAAFAVAIVSLTDADLLLIGIAYFFRYLPSVVFSPVGGWLADNAEKRKHCWQSRLPKAFWRLPSLPCSACSPRYYLYWLVLQWS